MNIAIIGAGAAGMLAAAELSSDKNISVTIFEKNEKCGKKLYITGKGRCNLTNLSDTETVLKNVVHNSKFLYPALNLFSSEDVFQYFEELGLSLKVERGNRVFPSSDKSSDVIAALERKMKKNNVKLRFKSPVEKIVIENGNAIGLISNGNIYKFDAIIVATGGLSYPSTGSTGDGYRFAVDAGHSLQPTSPALCELYIDFAGTAGNRKILFKDTPSVEGLSLKNVTLTASDCGKTVCSEFGEMLFTKNGISGPIALTVSSYISQNLSKTLQLTLDLKPAISEDQLDARLLREMDGNKNKMFKNILQELLPQKIIPLIILLSEIDAEKEVHQITKEERAKLLRLLKNLELSGVSLSGYQNAVITSGGVTVKEIVPKTMESKLVKQLFFVGEVLDIDALTGGFNLQIAMSTAFSAATELKRRAVNDIKDSD